MRPIAEKLGIRSGEGRLVVVAALTLGAVVALNVIVTAAVTGLVLGAYGGQVLPLLYAAGALFSIVLSLSASVAVGRLSRFAETAGVLLTFALLLGVGRLGLAFNPRWVSAALHPIALTVSVLLVGQTYTLIGDRLDSGQAKRLLPSIGAGSTLGALLASGCLLGFSSRMGAANLLVVGTGLGLMASVGASRLTLRFKPAPSRRMAPAEQVAPALWTRVRHWTDDPLFRSLSLLVLATTVGSTLFRFSFEAELGRTLEPSQIAAFIGGLNLAVNLVVLVIHGLVESRLIRAFGFRPGLASLPLVFGVGGVLWLTSPGLWVAAAVRFFDSTLRFSLARSSEELLLIPLPSVVRRRMRLLTTGAIAPLATVATSALLGVMGTRAVGLVALATGAVGVTAALLTFRPYLGQLRSAMAAHRLKLSAPSTSLPPLGSEVHAMIEEGLESDSPDDMCFSLRLAAESDLPLGPELIVQCLEHPQPHVRRAALSVVAERADATDRVRSLLTRESDASVAAAAIRVLASRATPEDQSLFERFASDERMELRFVALAAQKGEGALPTLVRALGEGREGRLASDALSLCPVVPTVAALAEALGGSSGRRRQEIVRALDRLHEGGGNLSPHREKLITALLRDLRFVVLCRLLRARPGTPPLVVREADLAHRHAENAVSRTVALLVSSREVRRACLSYASGDRRLRALSLDLLGALLPQELASLVMPLLEEVPLAVLVERARERFPMPHDVETDFATLLRDAREPELRWLALALLGETPKGPLEERMLPLLGELTSLRRVEIFSRLAPEDLIPIAEITREIEVASGSVVFSQGDAGNEFFIVLSGSLTVERHGRLVTELGPHGSFGETALLGRGRRTATVRAKTDCLLSVISSGDFEDLLDVHPSIARAMLTILAQRFDSLPPSLPPSL
jgi:hypothetical protein